METTTDGVHGPRIVRFIVHLGSHFEQVDPHEIEFKCGRVDPFSICIKNVLHGPVELTRPRKEVVSC